MGQTFHMDLRDVAVSSSLCAERVWEPEETSFVMKTLQPGMVFVDVGAHIGYYTLIASSIVGDSGKVFAFEPDPGNFAFLQKNVRVNHCRNAVTEQKAVTASSQRVLLYCSENNFGDHRIYDPEGEHLHLRARRRRSVAVEAISLDDYFKDKPPRVDFIKMDIQGAEYGAFVGMQKTLQQNSGIIVLAEFWPKGLEQAGAPPRLLLDEVRKLSFKIYRIDKQGPCETSPSDILNSLTGDAYVNLALSRKDLPVRVREE
jgi:FkbM family methyltransferase